MRKGLLTVFLAALCTIVLSSSVVQAAENWLGTWTLDAAKSKFSPGPGPQSLTLKFESTRAGIMFTGDGVGADGKAAHSAYVSRFEGKEVPYEGNPDADTCAPKKIDKNSYENTWKKAGKPTISAKAVVSADGKTMTITQTGMNAKGEAVNNTIVYNKQ